jgi:hypothetical protein
MDFTEVIFNLAKTNPDITAEYIKVFFGSTSQLSRSALLA